MSQGTLAIFRKRSTLFSCGYCKDNEKRNYSHGLVVMQLSPIAYSKMMKRGWRRSGNYLYKPIMNKTCCPQYTIRLNVDRYQLSRSHKKVLKNLKRYLKDGTRPIHTFDEENTSVPIKKSKNDTKTNNAKTTINSLNSKSMKKKIIRRERALDKLRSKGVNIEEYQRERAMKEEERKKTLENYMSELRILEGDNKLTFRLVFVGSDEFRETKEESYEIYKKYQETIHKDSNNSQSNWHDFLCCGDIFKGYNSEGESTFIYGAYHYQYVINDKIVAVSVLDILPDLVSAKYFYYDPEYAFLNLGTYSALREIYFVKTLHKTLPELQYYYMGFYIHNCRKMRYKANFRPSELLCDQSYKWMDLKEATEMIDDNNGNFTIFYPDSSDIESIDLDRVRFLNARKEIHGYRSMARQMGYEYLNDSYQREVIQFMMDRIGKTCYEMRFFIIGERKNYDSDSD